MNDTGNFVIFGPKANCTLDLCPVEMSVYGYRPSLPANAAFAALFTLGTAIHAYLGFKWQTPWFMWCLILSCTHEVAGYVARILLWVNPWGFGAFITQITITQAPVFYCAAIYVTLGQSIEHYGPGLARFPTKYFAWVFVPMDVISLILQGNGGGLSASSSGASQVGVDVAMAGLILQLIMLVAFSVLFADYMFQYLRSKATRSFQSRDKLFFTFLAISVLTTLARCIFRCYELKEGYSGELIKHEDLFIALEGVLIIVAVFCLGIAHPGFIFNRTAKVYYSVATGAAGSDDSTYLSKLSNPVTEPMRQHDTYGA
ncbi:related to parasitic phase-specific protein PSP-1 [Fusarium torulosum]|uniref:Related to parasitic phase-specific protein PSP-1 n=1 Tax=Fusarium torulosum TaxID=33205 RepID=A0AAE8MBP2_9HYPO|nr:related to parasitic phase-specific protein PSP-1 [Fusarium torulosum]